MLLRIDGHCVEAQPEQSLLQIVRQLGMDSSELSGRPLAAKIAGEVFTLNYVPVRKKDMDQDRPSMRRAMAASGGEVRLLRERSVCFVIMTKREKRPISVPRSL